MDNIGGQVTSLGDGGHIASPRFLKGGYRPPDSYPSSTIEKDAQMTELTAPAAGSGEHPPEPDMPSPEILAFIRFCHRRRSAAWPALYDEMWGVAARREYRGWGHDELSARGLTFSLREMSRLASWAQAVVAEESEPAQAGMPILNVQTAGA